MSPAIGRHHSCRDLHHSHQAYAHAPGSRNCCCCDAVCLQLCDLYENDCIFDKFDCCMNGNATYVTSGSYNNQFKVGTLHYVAPVFEVRLACVIACKSALWKSAACRWINCLRMLPG
eukprot:GHUV01043844.1.p1 GENE.GHUV01043844.1~~GHUV01043844.1.p1  ORF type:complete len:117 (-),score=16.85 GHUV01043844.1:46-396(-)